MKKLLIALALVSAVGCGASPTQPSTTLSTVSPQASQPAPAPEPAPADPTPAPVPPVPPAPAPSPDELRFNGETGQAHWYGPAIFSGHFELVIYWDHVEASGHGFDILSKTPFGYIAGTRNTETLSIEDHGGQWVWTYNGLSGQASGSLVRR